MTTVPLEKMPKKWQKLAHRAVKELVVELDAIEDDNLFYSHIDRLGDATCEYAVEWLPGPRDDGEFPSVRCPDGLYREAQNLVYDWQTAVEQMVCEEVLGNTPV